VALIIGTVELVSILTDKLHIDSGPLAAIGSLDLNFVGYAIVGLFVLTWIVALSVWRFGRIEQKWTSKLAGAGSSTAD
jgi:high-affinity nickel-transport protein